MLGSLTAYIEAKIALLMFVILTVWWLGLTFYFGKQGSDQNQLYAAVYGAMALWGGVWGILLSFKWGGLKSVLGRSIFMFSLGLLAQEFGQISYSYYIYFLHISVPYPSIGDIGYFGSIPLYTYAVYLLGKASGVRFGIKSFKNKILAVILPLIVLSIGYYLFLQGYTFNWSKPLTIFLDFGYPLGEAIYISMGLITYSLSRKFLGGIMKNKILFILFALFIQFLSDYTFLYQNQKNTWYAGGVNDYMYLCAYFLMTMGLFQLKNIYTKLKK